MKVLFQSIRRGDFEKVKSLIEKKPELLNCTAKTPPKKDDGQSPLQVAFKTGNLDIANLLMDNGANVNFIETESINEWRAPVIHDAINVVIFSSRFFSGIYLDEIINTKEGFEKAIDCFKKLINLGANTNSIDSYGNNCLMRFALSADGLLLSKENLELIEDLKSFLDLLIDFGADINYNSENKKKLIEFCGERPISKLFEKYM